MKLSNDSEKLLKEGLEKPKDSQRGLAFLKKKAKLPTHQQCLELFKQYKVPQNIFQHCLKVRGVALFLAEKLREKGISLNLEFIDPLALLHDLFKVVSLKSLESNSEEEITMWKHLRKKYPCHYESDVAYSILKDDFPELALSFKKISNPREQRNFEEIIVHYADWRILNERIVALKDRLEYLKKIYPRNEKIWKENEKAIKEDEEKIFSNLSFLPDELNEKIGKKD